MSNFSILDKEAPKAKIRPEPKKKGKMYFLLLKMYVYCKNSSVVFVSVFVK